MSKCQLCILCIYKCSNILHRKYPKQRKSMWKPLILVELWHLAPHMNSLPWFLDIARQVHVCAWQEGISDVLVLETNWMLNHRQ